MEAKIRQGSNNERSGKGSDRRNYEVELKVIFVYLTDVEKIGIQEHLDKSECDGYSEKRQTGQNNIQIYKQSMERQFLLFSGGDRFSFSSFAGKQTCGLTRY